MQVLPTGSLPQISRTPRSCGCTNTDGEGGGAQMSKLRSNTCWATASLLFMSLIEEMRSAPWPTMMAVTTSCESPGAMVKGPDERKRRRSAGFESSQLVGLDGAPGLSPDT